MLIVEDDASVRKFLARTLTEVGFEVIAVGSAVQGLAALGSNRSIAMILLDLMMPDVDGVEFRRRQLADPRFADIPVVVLTGAALAQIDDATLQAADYLLKPVGRGHLLSVVAAYCRPAH